MAHPGANQVVPAPTVVVAQLLAVQLQVGSLTLGIAANATQPVTQSRGRFLRGDRCGGLALLYFRPRLQLRVITLEHVR
ncbi:hypothetical protein D3C78_1487270 [compost metagenome]